MSVVGGRVGDGEIRGDGRHAGVVAARRVPVRSGAWPAPAVRRGSGEGQRVGGSKAYPYGSTSAVRAQVLAALGVLKVATADQMHRLMAPGHKDNKGFRNACLDLAKHGLTLSEGAARDGNKLWGLTPLGLDAAAEVLGRPPGEMGGAARSGAPHAMAVNETAIAITRTPPTATRRIPGASGPGAAAAQCSCPTTKPPEPRSYQGRFSLANSQIRVPAEAVRGGVMAASLVHRRAWPEPASRRRAWRLAGLRRQGLLR